MSSVAKARYFACIIYRDSAPTGWEAYLETMGLPMAISPCHDKDKPDPMTDEAIKKRARRDARKQCGEDDGSFEYKAKFAVTENGIIRALIEERKNLPEFKKEHWHVLIVNPNPITIDAMRRKLQRKLGKEVVNYVEIVDNVENYYKYLTHESSDAIAHKKHVYDQKDIKHLNSFDIERYKTLDREQKQELFIELVEVVYKFRLRNLRELMDYLLTADQGKELGITSMRDLVKAVDGNAWFLKMLFDGNYQCEVWASQTSQED